eukprot:scaffold9013_cov31-Tisochrysis_lutea.AAC.1
MTSSSMNHSPLPRTFPAKYDLCSVPTAPVAMQTRPAIVRASSVSSGVGQAATADGRCAPNTLYRSEHAAHRRSNAVASMVGCFSSIPPRSLAIDLSTPLSKPEVAPSPPPGRLHRNPRCSSSTDASSVRQGRREAQGHESSAHAHGECEHNQSGAEYGADERVRSTVRLYRRRIAPARVDARLGRVALLIGSGGGNGPNPEARAGLRGQTAPV